MKKTFVKKIPTDLTTYDFLKSLAVITLLAEYIGIYFFPDDMGWRIVGRASMPIWFFLIGYARTRHIPDYLWGGALVLLISSLVVGESVFSLNPLVLIILVRLSIDSIMRFSLANLQYLLLVTLAMAVLILPTFVLIEYGTQGFLFAMFGYLVRHQRKIALSREGILVFMGAIFLIYVIAQKLILGMDDVEFYTMGAGVFMVCLLLSVFEAKYFPEFTPRTPAFVMGTIKFMGRKTLEIYVVLLLLFKAAGLELYPERFELFGWGWF